MNEVSVGVTLPQFTDDATRVVGAAQRAEKAGLDSVWLFDHLWPFFATKERPMFESWTTLSWIAAATERVRVGTLVTRSTLRHPAVLAKMAATVAEMAPRRLIVGLGSGDETSRDENGSLGIAHLSARERVPQLASTVSVVRSYLHEPATTVHDRFVRVTGLRPSPRPSPPPVWIGGRSPAILEVAGRLADGWNGWGSPADEFRRESTTVLEAAEGRPMELSWGGLVILGADDDDARAKLRSRDPTEYVVGGPKTVADHLSRIVDAGARHLVLTLTDAARPGSYERLADDVAADMGLR